MTRLVALAALCGCGYAFTATGGALPGGASSLAVPVFENRTSEAQAGALFADALRDALARRTRLTTSSDASARVEGVVSSIGGGPSALAAGSSVGAFRVEAVVELSVVEGARVLYTDRVAGGEDYLPGVDLLGSEANRRAALTRLARSLMAEALSRMQASGGAAPR